MSASGDSFSRTRSLIDRMTELGEVGASTFTNLVPRSLLLPVFATLAGAAEAITAFFGVPISIFDTIAGVIGDLIEAIFGGGALIIDTGAIVSANSLEQGIWAQFGPFSFAVAFGAIGLAAYVLAQVRSEPETSNLIPLTGIDIPFLGTDEEGEDDGL